MTCGRLFTDGNKASVHALCVCVCVCVCVCAPSRRHSGTFKLPAALATCSRFVGHVRHGNRPGPKIKVHVVLVLQECGCSCSLRGRPGGPPGPRAGLTPNGPRGLRVRLAPPPSQPPGPDQYLRRPGPPARPGFESYGPPGLTTGLGCGRLGRSDVHTGHP